MAASEEMAALRTYLQRTRIGSDLRQVQDSEQGELALDRETLLAQMDGGGLAADPTRWAAARALFDWFQERYHKTYQTHHRRYHQRLRELQDNWEDLGRQLEALAQMNQLAELGKPVGVDLFSMRDRLAARMIPCAVEDLPKDEPICPQCRIQLGSNPPREELAALREKVRRALHTQQRRLARQTVARIMAQQHHPLLDRLLRAARAADLSDLVSIIDEEMVAFLRQFLAPVPAYEAIASVGRPLRDPPAIREVPLAAAQLMAALQQRFPTIGENQIEAVSQEMGRLLREALTQAGGSGQTVRLRLG